MNKIKILSKYIVNQIAAGEVIERPSSVLRELLENSIDANAKNIDIFIKDSGKTLIQLVDDGDGMNINDAKISIKKYATSKIKNIEDIYNISTKGFRGEALAAISLISQLEIQTKDKNSALGIHLFIENGKINKEIPLYMMKGTRVSVKNIFHGFPARRAYLRSSQIEFRNIVNEFYKIILSHRNIKYRFYHNDKIYFFIDKNISLKERITKIFNFKKNNFKSIFIKKDKFFINVIFNIPNRFSYKKGIQLIIVNKRSIKNYFLHKKIVSAYNRFFKNFHTISYFVFIEIDPKLVNWNIHPAKKEVQIEEENNIGNIIHKNIKTLLLDQYFVTKEELYNKNIEYLSVSEKNKDYNFLIKKKSSKDEINQLENLLKNAINKSNRENDILNFYQKKNFKNIFQINNKYIIVINNDNCLLIDQYRAYKNILFESFFKRKIETAKISYPIEIKFLQKKEKIIIYDIIKYLKSMGFYLYDCNQKIYLYSFPKKLTKYISIKVVKNIFCKYNENNNKEKIFINSIFQFSSIKYGVKLCKKKMNSLVKELFFCENPNYTYTSGSQILFIINKDFFEKIFE
ncbi:DNA mismatch repair endonuclease MutL [Blattabacterium cuenoti]|uniref:DNA mismatch repair endonuclease MutL n=1 Tax=Blattabacterium cuenoti TaxID=1653831 RepID=UPI001EEB7BC1|nr:DNA mismatch repair endonuclease MutL [Blattabacterium cuenoti]